MILTGTLHQHVSPADVAINKLRRHVSTITVLTEIVGLTVDQITARFYVRGGQDHRFAEPDAMDAYLRVLNAVPGARGAAARDAFLRGWAEHRSVPATPVVWHRYFAGTAIEVHLEARR